MLVWCKFNNVQGGVRRVFGKIELEGKRRVRKWFAEKSDEMSWEGGEVQPERLRNAKGVVKRGS